MNFNELLEGGNKNSIDSWLIDPNSDSDIYCTLYLVNAVK